MRTEQFISLSYQKERERIIQELEDVIPALSLEKGIINIQSKVRVHDSLEIVREAGHSCILHFNCSGNILIYLDNSGNRMRKLASSEGGNDFQLKIAPDALDVQHLRFLKKLHPKTFPEMLRAAGKKYLLD